MSYDNRSVWSKLMDLRQAEEASPIMHHRGRSLQADYCEERFLAALHRGDDRASTFWARMEAKYLGYTHATVMQPFRVTRE